MATLATALPPLGGLLILGTLPVVGPWLEGQQWTGLALYTAGFVIFAGLALLPTYAQAALGGWAFGFGWGFPAAMIGFAGAAMLAHPLAGRVAGQRLVEVIDRRPNWRALHGELTASGFWRTTLLVTLLRLPPTSPFALGNVLLASARVPWWPYLVGTVVGLAPRTAAAVLAAAGIAELGHEHRPPGASDWPLLLTLGVTVIVTIALGLLARRALRRMTPACHEVPSLDANGEQPPSEQT
ncbi:MAG: VTT domain-containing protein [Phycisphaeraceae bacterium]